MARAVMQHTLDGYRSMAEPIDTDTTYWLSQQFKITFGPYKDRLIVAAHRGENGPVNLLLTRRMVMIVLHGYAAGKQATNHGIQGAAYA